MMSRKDYIRLSEALLKSYQSDYSYDVDQYANTVWYLGQALKLDNPNFDYKKFEEACGL